MLRMPAGPEGGGVDYHGNQGNNQSANSAANQSAASILQSVKEQVTIVTIFINHRKVHHNVSPIFYYALFFHMKPYTEFYFISGQVQIMEHLL